MVAPKKPNPATKQTAQRSSTAKATATKAPAKKVAATKTASKPAASKTPASAAERASSPSGTSRATAAKKSAADKGDAAPATKATVTKGPVKKATASKPAEAKAPVARRVPKPPSPDTPALLSNYRPDRHEIPEPRGHSKDGIAYTKDFDVKFLKMQRDELIARRQSELARATRLEDEATSLIEDGEMGDVQFDDEGGEGDTMVVQRDLDRVLSTQARQTIEDIDAALERIKIGTYGYSEVSGLPIPRERLEALPETTVLAAEKVSGIGLR
jgi:RNA polymerase-binding transcription factor DksA